MAHNVSNEYKQVIYSGDAKNNLKILFNNVELQNADLYCEKLTVTSRIIPNGSKIFNLNNFISKEADLILHDIDTSIIQNQVSISIGTLVGNSYEYVPIGIFNIQDQPTNDKNKTTIKLRDNSVKFDFNYNAQTLIESNNGSATKLQILQDICTQAGVTCNITSFIGYIDEIGVYDNTITAREYISRIAEQAGKIATINRSGELIFVDLNNLTTWEIPIDIVEKYENGTKFKIGRVVYEDGIVRYETPTSNDDTLFLDGSNNFINGELVKEQASSSDNTYDLEDTGDSKLDYFTIDGKTEQYTTTGKNLLQPYPNNSSANGITCSYDSVSQTYTFNGTCSSNNTTFRLGNKAIDFVANSTRVNAYWISGNVTNYCMLRTFDSNYAASTNLNLTNLSSTNQVIGATRTGTSYTASASGISVRFDNGSVATNFKVKFMIANTTNTTYEPYTGEESSPNPNYPQELVSVGYQNLFNKNAEQNVGSQNVTVLDTGIRMTATSGGTYRWNGWYFSNDLLGKTITFSATITPSATNNGGIRFWFFDSNGNATNTIGSALTSSGSKTITIPSSFPSGTTYIGIVMYANLDGTGGTGVYVDYTNLQITESETQLAYIPYGKYGIEAKTTGKNLFDKDSVNILNAKYGATITADNNERMLYIPCKPNTTYTLYHIATTPMRNSIGTTQTTPAIGVTIEDGVYSSTSPKTITTNSNAKYIVWQFYAMNDTTNTLQQVLDSIQIEKGSIATTYEAYKLNTYLYTLDEPLRAIENYKDKLYIKNGILYVERKIATALLDGTEHWQKWDQVSSGDTILCGTNIIDNIPRISYKSKSNYFVCPTASMWSTDTSGLTVAGTGQTVTRIRIKKTIATNAGELKTWLSTHNTEVQYVLVTPTIEELGEIEIPQTYNNITYIDVYSNINTNSYLQYRKNKTQLEQILDEVDEFDIDSLKTGKILGNPAIDSYDLIQIHDKSKNLFDINGSVTTGTLDKYNNGFTLKKSNNRVIRFKLHQNYPAGTYTLYCNVINNSLSSLDKLGLAIQDSSNNTLVSFSPLVNGNFTVNAQFRNLYFFINQDQANDATITLDDIMLIEGNNKIDYQPYRDETYTTLATNDLTYTGVLINTFDTQIGEEAKEQNVFVNGEETFKKWARTTIDNIEGSITLQAGQIDEANGKINQTNLTIDSQGALLNVIANNSNIDIAYDENNNPVSGEVREVTTTTGFTFNAEGMTIEDSQSNFKALHRNTGTYYQDGTTIVGQYTKDGSKQKDLDLFGVYTYGKNDIDETPMFIAQLFTDGNGEECFGHFYNRGD